MIVKFIKTLHYFGLNKNMLLLCTLVTTIINIYDFMKINRFINYICIAFMACTSMFVASCDDNDTSETPSTSSEEVKLRNASINEGAEVNADEVTSITLLYNTTVAVASNANITLNGTPVIAESGKTTIMEVVVKMSLEDDKSYTLVIPAGAIVSTKDAKSFAQEFKLNFKTKKIDRPNDDLPDNDAMAMTRKLGYGWNLGNHFDTSGGPAGPFDKFPESWGKYWDTKSVTESLYKNLAAIGVKTVRMPVTWGNYQDSTSVAYTIEKAYMDEIAQNVEWAEKAGLNVILNTHHDEYWLNILGASKNNDTNEKVKARIEATWKQIAERFKDKGDFLMFETFNEIQDGGWGWGASRTDGGKQYRVLNEWNQLVVDVIRATGGNNATRWIGVPGYAANPVFTLDNLTLPNDPASHIMVGVHCYDPYEFCTTRKYSEWGHTGAANKKVSGSDEDYLDGLFNKLKTKYIDHNIPCYMGEFGATIQPTSRGELFRAYYLEYFCRSAYFHGIPVMLWDNNAKDQNGEPFYFVNHTDGTLYNKPLMEMMIKASTSDDANYTLESVYNKAPK